MLLLLLALAFVPISLRDYLTINFLNLNRERVEENKIKIVKFVQSPVTRDGVGNIEQDGNIRP